MKRAETYTSFLKDQEVRDNYTYDVSELGKSIAENTRGVRPLLDLYADTVEHIKSATGQG